MRGYTSSGVIGRPSLASAEKGEALLVALTHLAPAIHRCTEIAAIAARDPSSCGRGRSGLSRGAARVGGMGGRGGRGRGGCWSVSWSSRPNRLGVAERSATSPGQDSVDVEAGTSNARVSDAASAGHSASCKASGSTAASTGAQRRRGSHSLGSPNTLRRRSYRWRLVCSFARSELVQVTTRLGGHEQRVVAAQVRISSVGCPVTLPPTSSAASSVICAARAAR